MMKQQDVATALGLTQSAISQYLRSVRGRALKIESIEGVDQVVKEMADTISNGDSSPTFLRTKYCEICRCIRETRLLCNLHKKVDPDFDVDGCTSCLPSIPRC